MEDEFDFSQAQVVDPYAIDYGYEEEEELDEFGNPIDPTNPPLPKFAPEKATWQSA